MNDSAEVKLQEASVTLDQAVKDSIYTLYSKGYEDITPEDVAEDIAYHYEDYEDWIDEIEAPERTEKYRNILASIMTYFNKYYDEYFSESLKEARQQTALKSSGVYSVMNNAWLKEPVATAIPDIDMTEFEKDFVVWEKKYLDIINEINKTFDNTLTEDIKVDNIKARQIIADQIKGEWEASSNYTKAVSDLAELTGIDTKEIQDLLLDIASEEHTHVGELETAYSMLDNSSESKIKDGKTEAEEKLTSAELTESDIDSKEQYYIDLIESFITQLYDLRKQGLQSELGEFSIQNLVFKEFRNNGYLDTLKELKNKLISKKFSL